METPEKLGGASSETTSPFAPTSALGRLFRGAQANRRSGGGTSQPCAPHRDRVHPRTVRVPEGNSRIAGVVGPRRRGSGAIGRARFRERGLAPRKTISAVGSRPTPRRRRATIRTAKSQRRHLVGDVEAESSRREGSSGRFAASVPWDRQASARPRAGAEAIARPAGALRQDALVESARSKEALRRARRRASGSIAPINTTTWSGSKAARCASRWAFAFSHPRDPRRAASPRRSSCRAVGADPACNGRSCLRAAATSQISFFIPLVTVIERFLV
jgi:hypothetical protein